MDYSAILEKLATTGASQQELSLLRSWLDQLSTEEYQEVLDKFESILIRQDVTEPSKEAWLQKILQVINEKEAVKRKPRILMRYAWKWAAAASVAILLGLAGYRYFSDNTPVAVVQAKAQLPSDIAAPKSNRAAITLGNGTTLYLDSVGNGQLAAWGNIKIFKLNNGQIVYQNSGNGNDVGDLPYNTLTNPRGSQVVDILLADGSHVWLNAGSSLSYPVAFADKERRVSLSGEGYFEVAKNPNKKFLVECNGIQTEVLGTHFNINSYKDESESKITLLEGSIKVSSSVGNKFKVLKVGQQAIGDDLAIINVRADQVISWKNGYFNLEGLSFTEIMQQLERWYDIQVRYASVPPDIELFGKIGRNLSLSEVVNSLNDMGVSCKIDQNRILLVKK